MFGWVKKVLCVYWERGVHVYNISLYYKQMISLSSFHVYKNKSLLTRILTGLLGQSDIPGSSPSFASYKLFDFGLELQ